MNRSAKKRSRGQRPIKKRPGGQRHPEVPKFEDNKSEENLLLIGIFILANLFIYWGLKQNLFLIYDLNIFWEIIITLILTTLIIIGGSWLTYSISNIS